MRLDPSYALAPQRQMTERSLARVVAPLLGPFILTAVAVSSLDDWNYLVKVVGMLMAAVYLAYMFRAKVWPTGEVLFFAVWVTWCLTGVFVAASDTLFQENWKTVFQIMVLTAIIAGLTYSRKILSYNLVWFLVAAFIIGGYSYVTGEYARVLVTVNERVEGLAVNSNQFAWIMILAVVAMAYFWMLPSRRARLKRFVLVCGFAAASGATLLTGSRKAVLGLIVFLPVWLFICYRKEKGLWRRPSVIFGLIFFIALAIAYVWVGSDLVIGKRFQETWVNYEAGREETRVSLYIKAWSAFLGHPLVGLGMANFRVYSGGLASHSEYAEVLADTGGVGFVLYFSIFLVFFLRLRKIRKYCTDVVDVRIAGLGLAFLVMILVVDVGRWNFSDKPFWIIMGSFVGYTSSVWSEWRSRQVPARPALSGMLLAPRSLRPL